jgi:hypothetical protein
VFRIGDLGANPVVWLGAAPALAFSGAARNDAMMIEQRASDGCG